MMWKLSMRNAKRQIREYLIYFITVTVCTSLMFGFSCLVYSEVIQECEMGVIIITIMGASILVMFIMAWLISYMMNFMLKKRSRELSIYMVLGIENKKIVRMFLAENIIIGILALLIGYVIGGFIFQALSAILLNMLGRQYTLSLVYPLKAVGVAALYFMFAYLLALWRSNRKIRKMVLNDMLHYGRKNEESVVKGKKSHIAIFLLSLIFFAVGLFLFLEQPIGDLIDTPVGIAFFVLFIYGLFMSLPDVIAIALSGKPRWKFKGSNMILLRSFSTKINNISITMATLSSLFTISVFIISVVMLLGAMLNQRAALVPFDLTIIDKIGEGDFSEYQDYIEDSIEIKEQYTYPVFMSASSEYMKRFILQIPYFNVQHNGNYSDMYMRYSDYIQLRDMLGLESVNMDSSSFLVHSLSYMKPEIEDYFAESPVLTIGKTQLQYAGIHTEHFDQYDGMSNGNLFIFVVPDAVAETLEVCYVRCSFITSLPIQSTQYTALFEQFSSLHPYRVTMGSTSGSSWESDAMLVDGKLAVQISNAEVYAMIALPLFYLAFILCVTGISVLSAHILSDEKNERQQLTVLKNIGYSRKQIDRMLLKRIGLIFLIPAIPAMTLNGALSFMFSRGISANIFVTTGQLWQNVILANIIFLIVYFVYYVATYVIHRGNVN